MRFFCDIFARLDALEPRVIEIGVAEITTIFEPSASASTAAAYADFGILDDATFDTLARDNGSHSRSSA